MTDDGREFPPLLGSPGSPLLRSPRQRLAFLTRAITLHEARRDAGGAPLARRLVEAERELADEITAAVAGGMTHEAVRRIVGDRDR